MVKYSVSMVQVMHLLILFTETHIKIASLKTAKKLNQNIIQFLNPSIFIVLDIKPINPRLEYFGKFVTNTYNVSDFQ